jgi:murein DD-endopeptidase MepM/ murein hydrolase activator NlpD
MSPNKESKRLHGRHLENRVLSGRTLEGRTLEGRTLGGHVLRGTELPNRAFGAGTEPIYRLPFPDYVIERRAQPTGIYAHEQFPESRYAIDFLLNVDTPILAARGGKVIKIKYDSDRWGLNIQCANEVNYVAIDHGDGTYAEYLHLGKDRVKVQVGQNVEAGELLGYSGLSGCMSAPHLHLNVFKIEDRKAVSIPITFTKLK